jgi:hypothetical protein
LRSRTADAPDFSGQSNISVGSHPPLQKCRTAGVQDKTKTEEILFS